MASTFIWPCYPRFLRVTGGCNLICPPHMNLNKKHPLVNKTGQEVDLFKELSRRLVLAPQTANSTLGICRFVILKKK